MVLAGEEVLCLGKGWKNRKEREGKGWEPVDKHLGLLFHGTRCASDPEASSYWWEHWLLTGLIYIAFLVNHSMWFDLNNRLQTGPLIFNMATSGAWLTSFLAAMNVPASEGKSRRPETISLVVHFSEVWKCGKVWQSYDNVILFPCYDPFVILYLVLHFSKVWKCGIVWQSKDNVILFP